MIITLWLFIFAIVGIEYWFLNFHEQFSILLMLQKKGIIASEFLISPEPGRSLSLWLGWAGLILMLLMNLYSIRKRIGGFKNFGKLTSWLNFHIMCGLIGPTFIFFHCNFKVRGLVAISFWSMFISFTSGIVGRYFYLQLAGQKKDLEEDAEKILVGLQNCLDRNKINVQPEEKQKVVSGALSLAGVPNDVEDLSPFSTLFSAISGDIRMIYQSPQKPVSWPAITKDILSSYAVAKRRAMFLESFQKLMGYWHTFHFPFAVFMYVAAFIHIVSSLVLGV